jgi:hypothetical protein
VGRNWNADLSGLASLNEDLGGFLYLATWRLCESIKEKTFVRFLAESQSRKASYTQNWNADLGGLASLNKDLGGFLYLATWRLGESIKEKTFVRFLAESQSRKASDTQNWNADLGGLASLNADLGGVFF